MIITTTNAQTATMIGIRTSSLTLVT
jgi:hypothetical protein